VDLFDLGAVVHQLVDMLDILLEVRRFDSDELGEEEADVVFVFLRGVGTQLVFKFLALLKNTLIPR